MTLPPPNDTTLSPPRMIYPQTLAFPCECRLRDSLIGSCLYFIFTVFTLLLNKFPPLLFTLLFDVFSLP